MEQHQRVIDFVTANIGVFRTLTIIGHVPVSTANQYKIYCYFKTLDPTLPKMERYIIAAEYFRVSEKVVRNAIQQMEKPINVKL